MKKLIITIIILLNLNANEQKTINVNEHDNYVYILLEQFEKFETVKVINKVTAEIIISKTGSFEYKILSESNIIGYNEKVKNFLEEQKKIKYPTFKNTDFKVIVDFRAEIEEEKKAFKNESKKEMMEREIKEKFSK